MDPQSYTDLTLWSVLDSLKEMLGGDLSSETQDSRTAISLAHSVVQYIDSLRSVDAGLVDDDVIAALTQDLENVRDYLTSYQDDRESNFALLSSYAVPSLVRARTTAIQSMPPPLVDDQVRAAQEAADRYRAAADAQIEALRKRIDALSGRISEAGEQRTADAETAEASLAALQENIAESGRAVATQTTQLQEQIETQRTSFIEEADQRETLFKQAEADREAEAVDQRAKQAESAGQLVTQLAAYREQARGLIEATGRDAVSGDYQVWAKAQGEVAKWWNVAAVAVGLITVGALVWVVLGAQNDTTQFLIAKSSVGIIGLIVAGYCGRQAAEHRAEEQTAKRLGLDLAALEPFLENVDDPDSLRVEIARRVFAPELQPTEDRRISLGRRGMSLSELSEFVKIIKSPPS